MEENSVSDVLSINESAKAHLQTVSKWVFGISIIGIVGVLFLFSISIYDYILLSSCGDVPTGAGVGLYLIMIGTYFSFFISVVCFFPFYYLYKFSSYLKMALDVDDAELLENAFRYLKLHYKSIGILLLILAAIYFLISRIF